MINTNGKYPHYEYSIQVKYSPVRNPKNDGWIVDYSGQVKCSNYLRYKEPPNYYNIKKDLIGSYEWTYDSKNLDAPLLIQDDSSDLNSTEMIRPKISADKLKNKDVPPELYLVYCEVQLFSALKSKAEYDELIADVESYSGISQYHLVTDWNIDLISEAPPNGKGCCMSCCKVAKLFHDVVKDLF